jgi:hypothetical protein
MMFCAVQTSFWLPDVLSINEFLDRNSHRHDEAFSFQALLTMAR